MHNRRMPLGWMLVLILSGCALAVNLHGQSNLTLAEALALARNNNPDIVIARKQVEAARGGVIEARSGKLPSLVASGFLRKRETISESSLREEDYNANLRVVQSIYSGGAVGARNRIARLLQEKRELELAATTNRALMDVRVAWYELLLNRARIEVRQQSVGVLRDELKTQEERFAVGTVGELNVRRAEVSLANEQPELFEAQTRLQNSYLRLNELCGRSGDAPAFHALGRLEYLPFRPNLNECLAYAATARPEIRAREIDIEIEDQQMILDRAEQRPRVEAFTGYEVYSERDPDVGPEFNHGYVIGLNTSWNIFDGYATRGRLQATRARRDAAERALEANRLSVASDVRSAFLDLEQADRVLESETRNVESASESLEIARENLAAGLATQLDVLQAAADVTRTRTTRLNAVFLHNAALARLARATAREPEQLGARSRTAGAPEAKRNAQMFDVAKPPSGLTQR